MGDRVPSGQCVLLVLAAAGLVMAGVAGGAMLLQRHVSEEEVLMLGAIVAVVGLGAAALRRDNGDGDGLG